MTIYEFASIVLGWSVVIYIAVSAWHRFCARQPRPAPPRARCSCGVCAGRVQVRDLLLTGRQLADVSDGVIAVAGGMTHVATLGIDFIGAGGVGQCVVLVVDSPMWEQAVAPAIQRHLTAKAGA